jgi:hypothetical protein
MRRAESSHESKIFVTCRITTLTREFLEISVRFWRRWLQSLYRSANLSPCSSGRLVRRFHPMNLITVQKQSPIADLWFADSLSVMRDCWAEFPSVWSDWPPVIFSIRSTKTMSLDRYFVLYRESACHIRGCLIFWLCYRPCIAFSKAQSENLGSRGKILASLNQFRKSENCQTVRRKQMWARIWLTRLRRRLFCGHWASFHEKRYFELSLSGLAQYLCPIFGKGAIWVQNLESYRVWRFWMKFDRRREISRIESLKKMWSTVLCPSFPIDSVHSEGESIKPASPKSGLKYIDEDIRMFSWNVALLRWWNKKERCNSRVSSFFWTDQKSRIDKRAFSSSFSKKDFIQFSNRFRVIQNLDPIKRITSRSQIQSMGNLPPRICQLFQPLNSRGRDDQIGETARTTTSRIQTIAIESIVHCANWSVRQIENRVFSKELRLLHFTNWSASDRETNRSDHCSDFSFPNRLSGIFQILSRFATHVICSDVSRE